MPGGNGPRGSLPRPRVPPAPPQRLAGYPRTRVDVLPIERYATLIDSTTATPPQPMHQSQAPPRGLEEPRRACADRDVNPSCGATSVRTEVVPGSGSSRTRKPPLLGSRPPPRDDPDRRARLCHEIDSSGLSAKNSIRTNTPTISEVTGVPFG